MTRVMSQCLGSMPGSCQTRFKRMKPGGTAAHYSSTEEIRSLGTFYSNTKSFTEIIARSSGQLLQLRLIGLDHVSLCVKTDFVMN